MVYLGEERDFLVDFIPGVLVRLAFPCGSSGRTASRRHKLTTRLLGGFSHARGAAWRTLRQRHDFDSPLLPRITLHAHTDDGEPWGSRSFRSVFSIEASAAPQRRTSRSERLSEAVHFLESLRVPVDSPAEGGKCQGLVSHSRGNPARSETSFMRAGARCGAIRTACRAWSDKFHPGVLLAEASPALASQRE